MHDPLEITPAKGPIHGRVRPPGSKSITNRALVCAALASGESTLAGALDSEDTRVMIESLARRNAGLLAQAKPFEGQIADTRLALEVAVIQRLAESLNRRLLARDPLSDRVHHSKPEALGLALLTAARFLVARKRINKAGLQPAAHP